MKKLISILLCFCLVFGLVACGNNSDNPSTPNKNNISDGLFKNYPTLAASESWTYNQINRSEITELRIVDEYKPTGMEEKSWPAAVDKNDDGDYDDDIMCYLENGKLTIAGNGSGKIMANENSSYLFSSEDLPSFTKITKIEGLDLLDTSNVTDMSYMFNSCLSLTELDLSTFKTDKVTTMEGLFKGCEALEGLDISTFDTSNVTTMESMFEFCRSLKILDITHFVTTNTENIAFMFRCCQSITTLDVSNLDTSKVTDMRALFNYCESLTELDVSNFTTTNITDMTSMFGGLDSLTTLDLRSFDVSNVTSMNSMFKDSSNLQTLNTDGWNTQSLEDMDHMFENCKSLTYDCNQLDVSKVGKYAHEKFDTFADGVINPDWP